MVGLLLFIVSMSSNLDRIFTGNPPLLQTQDRDLTKPDLTTQA